jgi:hypothetical protein
VVQTNKEVKCETAQKRPGAGSPDHALRQGDEAMRTTTSTGLERSGTRDAQPDSYSTESGAKR